MYISSIILLPPPPPPHPPQDGGLGWVGWGIGGGGGSRIILDICVYICIYLANGSIRIFNFAGPTPPALKINFAGPKAWEVKTDAAMCMLFFLCHVQLIESTQEIYCKTSSQESCLAMNFRKVVMSKAAIKNGRIVITNGMITFEHYTDTINVDGVRDRETNPVYTIEQSPSVIKLHS